MYTEKVMHFFKDPLNQGNITHPDGYGCFEDRVNTNVIEVFLKIKAGRIDDIKFRTLGCIPAVAASVAITMMAKGKLLRDAQRISEDEVTAELGGLPETKKHCSILAVKGLRAAIKNYRKGL